MLHLGTVPRMLQFGTQTPLALNRNARAVPRMLHLGTVPRMLQVGAVPFCYKGQVGAGSPASEGVLELSAMVRGAGR